MRKQDTVRLDTHRLVACFEERDLKQWWLADQLGVHRKTVSRWLTGKVKRLDRKNAEALALALEVDLSRLTAPDPSADVMATREEQRVAARLVRERELLEILSPSDNWELAERLVRATLQPDLPKADLGRLYNLLCIAAWRQGRLDEARGHAELARRIAQDVSDGRLRAKAWANLGTVAWFEEDYDGAEAAFESALSEPEGFDTPRDQASVLFNLGLMLRSGARFARSLDLQRRAIAIYDQQDLPFNLAIAWMGVAVTRVELGAFAHARAALENAAANARRCDFKKGVHQVVIYTAAIDALTGTPHPPTCLEALEALSAFDAYDWTVHEDTARVARLAGDLRLARAQIAQVRRRHAEGSFGQATALQELARIEWAAGEEDLADMRWSEADAMFRALGFVERVHGGPVTEVGRLFPGYSDK